MKRGDIEIFGCAKLKHTLVNGVKVMEDDYYLIKLRTDIRYYRGFYEADGENGKRK